MKHTSTGSICPSPGVALGLLLMGCLFLSGCSSQNHTDDDMIVPAKLSLPEGVTEEGYEKGASGAFGGMLGDWLVYGAGCNFPDKGPLEGGPKRYYSRIYALRCDTEGTVVEQIALGDLEQPTGYGATVAAEDGSVLYLVGGTNGSDALTALYRVTLSDEGTPVMELLPYDLPHGWYEGSAALVGSKLYLIGGWSAPGQPMTSIQVIDLADEGAATELAPLPDGARIQPIAFAHKGELFVCGGFAPAKGDKKPVMQDRSYALSLAHPEQGCRVVSDGPTLDEDGRKLLFVGTAVAYDAALGKVYAAGGVDYDLFSSALLREYHQSQAQAAGDEAALRDFARQRVDYMTMAPEEYHFMPHLITLDCDSGTWRVVATDTAFATAGAALATRDGVVYLFGGERKPGVRTSDCWRVDLR